MTNLLNTNQSSQSRIFYVNPSEQVSTNLVDVEVVYNEVPETVNLIQQNIQALVNNGVFVNGPITINNTFVNSEEVTSDDDGESVEISINPELNLEVSLFRRLFESAPSVAIQTVIIYMLMSTLPSVNKVGEEDTNVVGVECSEKNPTHSDSYHKAQLLRGSMVANELVNNGNISESDLNSSEMVVNPNGTVDLKLPNGSTLNLVGYYNSHNDQYVQKATYSLCK